MSQQIDTQGGKFHPNCNSALDNGFSSSFPQPANNTSFFVFMPRYNVPSEQHRDIARPLPGVINIKFFPDLLQPFIEPSKPCTERQYIDGHSVTAIVSSPPPLSSNPPASRTVPSSSEAPLARRFSVTPPAAAAAAAAAIVRVSDCRNCD
jgi:hypothetical protein